MKILLTGHEGCVGSNLLDFLKNKADVICFDGDVTNVEDWSMYYGYSKIDVLIHLAAIPGVRRSFSEPEFYYKNNVEGTINALEFAKDSLIDKVLYASSSNAYEWWGNPYAATKKMNEVTAHNYENAKGMRFHTVWPGREDMLYKKLENNQVTYINSNHYRDWINVDDLCKAIWTIILNWSMIDKKVLDIGNGESVRVLDMAQKLFGWEGDIIEENPKGERVHTKADIQYLKDLGWSPQKRIMDEIK